MRCSVLAFSWKAFYVCISYCIDEFSPANTDFRDVREKFRWTLEESCDSLHQCLIETCDDVAISLYQAFNSLQSVYNWQLIGFSSLARPLVCITSRFVIDLYWRRWE
jgi:hypothetical protein